MENKGVVAIVLVVITIGMGVAGFVYINLPTGDTTNTTTSETTGTSTTTTGPTYTGPPVILRYQDLINLSIEVPDWSFPMVGGYNFTMSEHRGEIIFIDFMATWCYWCGQQNAEIKLLYDARGTEITIISVSATVGDTLEMLDEYATERELPWPHGRDEGGLASEFVGVPGIPSMIIVDGNGILRYFHVGYPFSYEDLPHAPEENSIVEVLAWITG